MISKTDSSIDSVKKVTNVYGVPQRKQSGSVIFFLYSAFPAVSYLTSWSSAIFHTLDMVESGYRR